MFDRYLPSLLLSLSLCLYPAFAASYWDTLGRSLFDDPVSVSERAMQLLEDYRNQGDKANELQAILLLVQAKTTVEEFRALDVLVPRGLILAKELGNTEAQARLQLADVRRLARSGDRNNAERVLDAVLVLTQPQKLTRERGLAYIEQALLLQDQNRVSEALPLLFKAHGLFSELGLQRESGEALNYIGNAYSNMENYKEAGNYYQRALAGLDPKHDRHTLVVRLHNLGASLYLNKQLAQAERTLREALGYAEGLKEQTGIAMVRYRLSLILIAQHQPEQALRLLDAAQVEFERDNNLELICLGLLARAEALALGGASAAKVALQALEKAQALSDRVPSERRQLVMHEAASRIYKLLGRYQDALGELEVWSQTYRSNNLRLNRALLTEMQARFDAQRQQVEYALLTSEKKRHAAELQAGQNRRLLLWLGLVACILIVFALMLLLLRQIRQKRRFADLALMDELTGAPNRRHIMAYGKGQLEACRAVGQPYSVAIIDLDHFKSINDRFGHEGGDVVLRQFAIACQRALRQGDLLGRVGGEEWLLVMPSTQGAELEQVFFRLREAVQAQVMPGLPAELRIAFSMGAAEMAPGESFDKLVQRADAAMYAAKKNGRDQLCLAEVIKH
ncbi:diguanylate cyclase [Chitinimonas sp. PSY-7]|uniref:diguanylate cyclase n=1 Tax=Chitinimonas sp. PSY-7 TaxID=3459088 RepID=UPI00403FF0C3